LENHLRGQLVEIVRNSQSQLFQRYRGDEPAAADTGAGPSQEMVPEFHQQSITGLEQNNNIYGAELLEFDFSAYIQLPPADENHIIPSDVFA